jgi:DNA-binding SARP family transcriptional activator
MRALYYARRQADSLATYRRARAMLHDQLGIEPSPDLRALEASILRHDLEPIAVQSGDER